jgi:hypothetical protein
MDQAIRIGDVALWNDGIVGLIGIWSNFLTQHSTIALKLHFVPSIPLFHAGGVKPASLKAACFQYVIEIPKH